MSLFALALAATASAPLGVEPVLWLDPRGTLFVNGNAARGRMTPGAQQVRTPLGIGLDLNGKRGGLLLQDLPALALARSLTISTWVYLRSYGSSGPAGQILFRGDDRIALDPYHLTVMPNGAVQFGIDCLDGSRPGVETEIPVKRWVRVTASFDAETGEMRLYKGDRVMVSRFTDRRSFESLDTDHAPGVGIGNVQNDHGPHNHPLNGILVDLRLYASAITPAEAGYRPGPDRDAP